MVALDSPTHLLQYSALGASPAEQTGTTADETIRANAHTDFGSLTLLFQRPSQPGLEIQNPDSTWSPVAVYPPGTEDDPFPPIVINIGDLLSYWTNGLMKSTMHRVKIPRNRTEDRYSIAYFCHPLAKTELITIPSALIERDASQSERKGEAKKVLTAAEHLWNRLAATYGWEKDSAVDATNVP